MPSVNFNLIFFSIVAIFKLLKEFMIIPLPLGLALSNRHLAESLGEELWVFKKLNSLIFL